MTIDTDVQRLVKEEIAQEEQARVERIRQQVLARRATEQAASDRQAHIAQLRADIADQLDPAPIDAAEAELGAALERYMQVCVAHDKRHSALWMDVTNLAGSGLVPVDMSASYVTGGTISSGGKDWKKSRLHTRLIRAARAALEKLGPLDHVDFSRNPQD
jgi:hypothetical protein